MTIREYIQSRVRLLRIIRLGWAVVPITVILIFPKWAKTFAVYLIAFAYLAMIAASSVVASQTKCPRCNGSLREFTSKWLNPRFGFSDSCPHCGVSIDEPM
jgi:hypothetical protein